MYTAIKVFGVALAGAAIVSWTPNADTQQPRGESYLAQSLPAPSKSFELKLGTAYAQGLGHVAPGKNISQRERRGLRDWFRGRLPHRSLGLHRFGNAVPGVWEPG